MIGKRTQCAGWHHSCKNPPDKEGVWCDACNTNRIDHLDKQFEALTGRGAMNEAEPPAISKQSHQDQHIFNKMSLTMRGTHSHTDANGTPFQHAHFWLAAQGHYRTENAPSSADEIRRKIELLITPCPGWNCPVDITPGRPMRKNHEPDCTVVTLMDAYAAAVARETYAPKITP